MYVIKNNILGLVKKEEDYINVKMVVGILLGILIIGLGYYGMKMLKYKVLNWWNGCKIERDKIIDYIVE